MCKDKLSAEFEEANASLPESATELSAEVSRGAQTQQRQEQTQPNKKTQKESTQKESTQKESTQKRSTSTTERHKCWTSDVRVRKGPADTPRHESSQPTSTYSASRHRPILVGTAERTIDSRQCSMNDIGNTNSQHPLPRIQPQRPQSNALQRSNPPAATQPSPSRHVGPAVHHGCHQRTTPASNKYRTYNDERGQYSSMTNTNPQRPSPTQTTKTSTA